MIKNEIEEAQKAAKIRDKMLAVVYDAVYKEVKKSINEFKNEDINLGFFAYDKKLALEVSRAGYIAIYDSFGGRVSAYWLSRAMGEHIGTTRKKLKILGIPHIANRGFSGSIKRSGTNPLSS